MIYIEINFCKKKINVMLCNYVFEKKILYGFDKNIILFYDGYRVILFLMVNVEIFG